MKQIVVTFTIDLVPELDAGELEEILDSTREWAAGEIQDAVSFNEGYMSNMDAQVGLRDIGLLESFKRKFRK